MKIIENVSKETGISYEDLTVNYCVELYRKNFMMRCDGDDCGACWDQEDQVEAKEEVSDPNILATISDEEAELIEDIRVKFMEARELRKKSKQMEAEAFLKKDAWFAGVKSKYGIAEGIIRFDPKTQTLRKDELNKEDLVMKILGAELGRGMR